MNRKQLSLLVMAALFFILSELFPAWVYEDENTSVRRSAGYHWRFSPPKVKSPSEMRKIFGLKETDPTRFMWVHRDGIREWGQRGAILFLAIGAVLISFNRRIFVVYVLGWLCLCVGIGLVALLIFHVFFLLS
jgi:hypothetical protein